jgi:hypothetical protein
LSNISYLINIKRICRQTPRNLTYHPLRVLYKFESYGLSSQLKLKKRTEAVIVFLGTFPWGFIGINIHIALFLKIGLIVGKSTIGVAPKP